MGLKTVAAYLTTLILAVSCFSESYLLLVGVCFVFFNSKKKKKEEEKEKKKVKCFAFVEIFIFCKNGLLALFRLRSYFCLLAYYPKIAPT